MKIVGFDDFCRMPAGTIFAPYEPCCLKGTLEIKTDAGWDDPSDKYCSHPFNGVMSLEPWIDGSEGLYNIGDRCDASFEIYDGDNVDYKDYKMFLVFEEADVDRLINALLWAKNGCVGYPDCSVEEEEV